MAQAVAAPSSVAQSAGPSIVAIIAGPANGTGVRIASDLSRLLDENDLRVFPIVGKGSVQDINDLLTLKAADIAILQSDVAARALAEKPGLDRSRRSNISPSFIRKTFTSYRGCSICA